MTLRTATVPFTYEDYRLFPADGKRHELIGGDHFMTPAPNARHQQISGNLHWHLQSYTRRERAGWVFAAPFDVVLSDVDVVQPDLIFLSRRRAAALTAENLRGAPELVVEILSPATRKVDETMKRKLYERAGVLEYWIVDPELESLRIYRGEGTFQHAAELSLEREDVLTTPLLPGFRLPLEEIFAPLDPFDQGE